VLKLQGEWRTLHSPSVEAVMKNCLLATGEVSSKVKF
jgi:hypothetical protein